MWDEEDLEAPSHPIVHGIAMVGLVLVAAIFIACEIAATVYGNVKDEISGFFAARVRQRRGRHI